MNSFTGSIKKNLIKFYLLFLSCLLSSCGWATNQTKVFPFSNDYGFVYGNYTGYVDANGQIELEKTIKEFYETEYINCESIVVGNGCLRNNDVYRATTIRTKDKLKYHSISCFDFDSKTVVEVYRILDSELLEKMKQEAGYEPTSFVGFQYGYYGIDSIDFVVGGYDADYKVIPILEITIDAKTNDLTYFDVYREDRPDEYLDSLARTGIASLDNSFNTPTYQIGDKTFSLDSNFLETNSDCYGDIYKDAKSKGYFVEKSIMIFNSELFLYVDITTSAKYVFKIEIDTGKADYLGEITIGPICGVVDLI